MKKPKIIHIITRLDKGGSAENTFLTVLGIDKKNYKVFQKIWDGAADIKLTLDKLEIQLEVLGKIVKSKNASNKILSFIKTVKRIDKEMGEIGFKIADEDLMFPLEVRRRARRLSEQKM